MSFSKLEWGVKASFRGYVEAAGGGATLSDGAEQTGDGTFVFSAEPGGDLAIHSDGSASGSQRFQGTVNFKAHGGMLDSTLAGLGIDVIDGALMLTVLEDPTTAGGDGESSRCAVAKLELLEPEAGGKLVLKSQITMDGMYQIADNYPPGTELDPVILE